MDAHVQGDAVHIGGDARQRFHDARGYGRPLGGNDVLVSFVEAAHLLFRGDLEAVDGEGFEAFFATATARRDRFALRFLVYADLRERGFYLSPARPDWPGPTDPDSMPDIAAEAVDFVVYERGAGPRDGDVAYWVRVSDALERLPAGDLAGLVVAVVDEESAVTYFDATTPSVAGDVDYDPPDAVEGVLLSDRVVVWDAPPSLYERGFYGQPITGRETVVDRGLQLSLVEAAALVATGSLELDGAGYDDIVARGRAVEGERFDRRLRVYTELRERGLVPKTGFKFGADFRTYAELESVEDLGHSESLVRVVPPDHVFEPRALSLDVRLSGGVRKRMVFALTDVDGVEWLAVTRLTP
jgi:tRNA-intron endonuclease